MFFETSYKCSQISVQLTNFSCTTLTATEKKSIRNIIKFQQPSFCRKNCVRDCNQLRFVSVLDKPWTRNNACCQTSQYYVYNCYWQNDMVTRHTYYIYIQSTDIHRQPSYRMTDSRIHLAGWRRVGCGFLYTPRPCTTGGRTIIKQFFTLTYLWQVQVNPVPYL